MKIKLNSKVVAALAVTCAVVMPGVAQAHGHGGGGFARGGISARLMSRSAGATSQMRRGGLDDRAGHDANDRRGGRGADDGINHDLNDDHGRNRRGGADDGIGHDRNDRRGGVQRAGTDDRAGHDAGDDRRRRRHGGGG